jgi:hypothetical protein
MSERYIPEHRRTQFKARNQFRPDELRRRREEQQVEIRKQKRDENLAKRRGIQTRDGGIGVGGGMAAATESDDEASAIESEVCIIWNRLCSCCAFCQPSMVLLRFFQFLFLFWSSPLRFRFLLCLSESMTSVFHRLILLFFFFVFVF